MKKILKTILLLSTVALLSACNKDNKQTYVFPEAPMLKQAREFIVNSEQLNVKAITLTEGGRYIVEEFFRPDSESAPVFHTGEYTAIQQTYVLTDWGKVVSKGVKASETVTLEITPAGGETVTVTATVNTPSSVNDLFRTWTVKNTRIRAEGKHAVTADFSGCNVNEIAELLNNNDIKIGDVPAGRKVLWLDVSAFGKLTAKFQSGEAAVGSITLQTESIGKYKWEDPDLAILFEEGNVSVDYDGSTCLLSLVSTYKDAAGETTITMTMAMQEYKN